MGRMREKRYRGRERRGNRGGESECGSERLRGRVIVGEG